MLSQSLLGGETHVEGHRKILLSRILLTFFLWTIPFFIYLSGQLSSYELKALPPKSYSANETISFVIPQYSEVPGDMGYVIYTQILNNQPLIKVLSDCIVPLEPSVQEDTYMVMFQNVTTIPCPLTVEISYSLGEKEVFSYNVMVFQGIYPQGVRYRSLALLTEQTYNSDGSLNVQKTSQILNVLFYDTVALTIASDHNVFQQWKSTVGVGNVLSFAFSVAGICWSVSRLLFLLFYRCRGKRVVSEIYLESGNVHLEV